MIPRHVFKDRLRGLQPRERTAFLATLWAARGWEVTVRDGTVVADRSDPTRERLTLEVEDGPTGSTDRAFRVRVRTGEGTMGDQALRTFDPDDLYDLLRYGVGRDRRNDVLRSLPADGHRSRSRPAGRPPAGEPRRSRHPWLTTTAPLVLVALVLVGTLVAGATAEGVAAPFAADQVDGRLRYVLQCGDHPVAVAPATLLPALAESEGFPSGSWETVPDPLAATEDRFRGSPVTTPESRAVTTYAGPDDRRYRVEIARWRTDWLAANAADRAIESTVRVTWVWWSFDVQVLGPTGEAVRGPAAAATALGLLGSIELPPTVDLDPACTGQLASL